MCKLKMLITVLRDGVILKEVRYRSGSCKEGRTGPGVGKELPIAYPE